MVKIFSIPLTDGERDRENCTLNGGSVTEAHHNREAKSLGKNMEKKVHLYNFKQILNSKIAKINHTSSRGPVLFFKVTCIELFRRPFQYQYMRSLLEFLNHDYK